MKAHQIDDKIEVYNNLPKSFGSVIGGFNNLSDAELQTHGFYDVEYPSDYDEKIHNLEELSFDSATKVFKYTKTNKSWVESLSELKELKISSLKEIYRHKLAETDWVIIRDKELDNTTEQSVLDARAALRTECTSKESEISALSTKANIIKFNLPGLK